MYIEIERKSADTLLMTTHRLLLQRFVGKVCPKSKTIHNHFFFIRRPKSKNLLHLILLATIYDSMILTTIASIGISHVASCTCIYTRQCRYADADTQCIRIRFSSLCFVCERRRRRKKK